MLMDIPTGAFMICIVRNCPVDREHNSQRALDESVYFESQLEFLISRSYSRFIP